MIVIKFGFIIEENIEKIWRKCGDSICFQRKSFTERVLAYRKMIS